MNIESHWNCQTNRLMRYNRTRSESRINTGVSLISSKLSSMKIPATDNRIFRKGGDETNPPMVIGDVSVLTALPQGAEWGAFPFRLLSIWHNRYG